MQTRFTLSLIMFLLSNNAAQAEEHKPFSEHVIKSINHVVNQVDDSMGYVVESTEKGAEMAPYIVEAAMDNSLQGPFEKWREFKEKKILFWKEGR